MDEQFLRTEMLLGPAAIKGLSRAHVAVFGIGGVGGYAVEALARAGVGTLTLVDHDTISVTNINRQVAALHSTVGIPKVEAMARRIADINPRAKVIPRMESYQIETGEQFFQQTYDYIIDAIDLVSCKLDLIERALKKELPIISALGTGNKLDASQLRVADIGETSGCPLARIVRKELRKRGILRHQVVFSPELPKEPAPLEAPPPGRRSVPASVPWVPACAGFLLAGAVVEALCKE